VTFTILWIYKTYGTTFMATNGVQKCVPLLSDQVITNISPLSLKATAGTSTSMINVMV
jgi:hypothetical protein